MIKSRNMNQDSLNFIKRVSPVYGSVSHNKGFGIGWFDLFIHSFTIYLNNNQLQELNQFSAEPFFLDCRGLAPFSFSFSRRTHTKHIRWPAMDICEPRRKYLFLYFCTYSALHSNGSYPIVPSVFVDTGICLPSRCLETSLHVTIVYECVNLFSWHRTESSCDILCTR
jgi:hypothetical protein